MDAYIYVQAKDVTPLMPTKRYAHVQKFLKHGKALVVEHMLFVIRMKMLINRRGGFEIFFFIQKAARSVIKYAGHLCRTGSRH